MSSLPGCLNHRILWVALVIPLAACSPGPSRHANLNPRVPELTLAYPPAKRDNVIDDYNGVRVAEFDDAERWAPARQGFRFARQPQLTQQPLFPSEIPTAAMLR